jgi:PIN domain nuclease of toxin-antitoxin system
VGGVHRRLKLLLDTHAFLWWIEESPRLGIRAREAVRRAAVVFVSAASAWEIATKRALGRLEAPADLRGAIAEYEFAELPITVDHAIAAATLPRHHDDPFDRVLVAQARLERLRLVTVDPAIRAYEVDVLPADR